MSKLPTTQLPDAPPTTGKLRQLHIILMEWEWQMLEQMTQGTHGAKSLLIRGLLRRFYKEQGLLGASPVPPLNTKSET